MTVWILCSRLVRGGAERQAVQTARVLADHGHDVEVVLFHGGGTLLDDLDGIHVRVLGGPTALLPLRLLLLMRAVRPSVVLSYLAVPNVVSVVARLLRRRPALLFGIRSTDLDLGDEPFLGRVCCRLEPILSRWSDGAIANSHAGRDAALARGVAAPFVAVVPNVVEADKWRASPAGRPAARASLGLEDEPVVGFVGRLHPMKDVPGLLAALGHLGRPAVLVAVGDGDPGYVRHLHARQVELGLDVRWLGSHDRVEELYPAMDVLVLPSAYGEGFSNVLAEAISAGTPCVATDVGDSRRLVGDRWTVPPHDPDALAACIDAALRLAPEERRAVVDAARSRIEATCNPAEFHRQLSAVIDRVRPAGTR